MLPQTGRSGTSCRAAHPPLLARPPGGASGEGGGFDGVVECIDIHQVTTLKHVDGLVRYGAEDLHDHRWSGCPARESLGG